MSKDLELLDNNPLLSSHGLDRLPTWLTDSKQLLEALASNPMSERNALTEDERFHALAVDKLKRIFIPTPQAVHIAGRMLKVLYTGLQDRNPRDQAVRRKLNALTQHLGRSQADLPWFPSQAQGVVVEGISGIGKSHIVDRVLSLLPQVVDHESEGEWGMLRLRQLVWLKVPMPADHSRMGLLLGMLTELDQALGTNYVAQHVKTNTRVEGLIVTVMFLLAQHRCGMLIIEEAQQENLGSPAFSKDFLNYFLRILNWGIPVTLVGNPLAFAPLRNHAQDADRFSAGGWFTLLPELGPSSRNWKDIWIPLLWCTTLPGHRDAVFEPIKRYPDVSSWDQLIWRFTGGLPRLVCRLRMDVLEWAVLHGHHEITSELVAFVYEQSASFTVSRERIEALATFDFNYLRKFNDLPVELLRLHWQRLLEKQPSEMPPEKVPVSKTVSEVAPTRRVTLGPRALSLQEQLSTDLKNATQLIQQRRQAKKSREK